MACLAWANIACAAGLGGINVTSALGQPLRAEIDLVAVDKIDKSTLVAKLASAETFKNAGLDYPYNLPKLKFQVDERPSGESFVRVTSVQPINEPFVTLLVELAWPSGKLMREFTFLLDPVGYQAEQPKEEVKPIEPVLAAPVVAPAVEPVVAPVATTEAEPIPETLAASAPAEAAPVATQAEEAAPAVAEAPAEQTPAEQQAAEQALTQESAPAETVLPTEDALSKEEAIAESTPATADEPIVVKRGDTLGKIAARIKPSDVSLERMLVALYRENAGVFDGHNMNRIRAGKILNVPQADAVAMLPQADAEDEIRAQASDWNAYRRKLAAARAEAADHADKQEGAGQISTAVTDKASADKEPAKEVLKLSKGEAPDDKVAGGGKTTTQDKAIAKEDDAIAKNKALKEAQERTALLEKNVKDMQRLAQLKQEAASAPSVAVTLPASAPQAASAVAEAKPRPKPAEPKVVEQPSLVDQLLEDPLYLAGGAVVLLLLGGAGFMVARRNKQGGAKKEPKSKKKEEVGATTGRIAAPVAPSPETGDFTAAAVASAPAPAAAAADTEEVDPIGEADLFLTFGRDAQAEEVLKEALKKNPNNIPVKLKLLSIYVNRKDTNSFLGYAREIKESGDVAAWEQAAAMGRELEPSNPFYGGSGETPDTTGNRSAQAAAPTVDFDLGFGATQPPKPALGQTTVLMEPPSQERTTTLTSDDLRSAIQSTPMDFDITGTNPGIPGGINTEATAVLNTDDLVFDVTATHPGVPAAAAAPAPAPAGDGGLAFTLDFPLDTPAAPASKPAAPVADLGFGGISLDLDNLGAAPATGGGNKDEHWHEVATKLDLAKAYQEMGDAAGAREILEEVLRDGDEQQKQTAQTLMQQL
jgi:pilus assembly protein FimV